MKKVNTGTHAKVKVMLEPLKGRTADARALFWAVRKSGDQFRT